MMRALRRGGGTFHPLLRAVCVIAVTASAVAAGNPSSAATTPTPPLTGRRITLVDNDTVCVNNATSNYTLVHDGKITFNFYVGRDPAKVFQIPKCIFATEVAQTLMSKVNLSETLESYRRRYMDYLVVPMYGSYKLYRTPRPAATAVPPTAASGANMSADLTLTKVPEGLHYSSKNSSRSSCVLFDDHPVVFPVYEQCVLQNYVTTGSGNIRVTVTQKFFLVSFGSAQRRGNVMAFGDLTNLQIKAPYDKDNFLLRQTTIHDLLVVMKEDDARRTYPFVGDRLFLDRTLSADYCDPQTAISSFYKTAAVTMLKGECGRVTANTLQLFFEYGMLTQTTTGCGRSWMPTADLIHLYSTIFAAQRFLSLCFHRRSSKLTPTSAADLATEMTRKGDAWSEETLLDLAYVLSSSGLDIPDKIFSAIMGTVEEIHRHNMLFGLRSEHRPSVHAIDLIVHSGAGQNAQQRRRLMAMLTGMCSPREIISWGTYVTSHGDPDLRHTYTPCFGGGRRDYTDARLSELFGVNPTTQPYVTSLSAALRALTNFTLRTFPEISCLPATLRMAAIPVSDVTYLITDGYALVGKAYSVTNTVVQHNIIVTAVLPNETCQLTDKLQFPGTIIVAKNITSTDRCEYCGSVLVEYDEVDGLTNILYVHDTADLMAITNDNNQILSYSARTHYLMLTRNGTVMEVTTIFVDVRETSVLLICVYVLFAIAVLFGISRLCKLL